MSFTSTLSVRTRAVLVYVVKRFFYSTVSMENILQTVVKIIIVGCLFEKATVECNRQFLPPPPLPYYQNDDYFLPGYPQTHRNQVPLYYGESAPPPVVYPYVPPQLFYQNENYNPPPVPNPGLRYSPPQPPKPTFLQPYKPIKKMNLEIAQVNSKKHSPPKARPQDVPPKKSEFFASNIILKEENSPPYYHDDYNKNYSDEDYTDNYSDESPPPPEPCLMESPYRFFEPPKFGPNADKQNLCNPYFQPNFGNSVYTLKIPVTLLPSRFPPRVEQLIERIQNYFSTYTQQNAENQTSTVAPVTQAPSESTTPSASTEGLNKKTTTESQQLNSEQTSPSVIEITTSGPEVEQFTEKTSAAPIETKEQETPSTPTPDVTFSVPQSTQKFTEGSEPVSGVPETTFYYGWDQRMGPQKTETSTGSPQPEVGSVTDTFEFQPEVAKSENPVPETRPIEFQAPAGVNESAETTTGKTEVNGDVRHTSETFHDVTNNNG